MTERQIVAILKEAEAGGVPVLELCRRHNISQCKFHKWRSEFGGMEASDVEHLKELEEENRQLKQIYTDSSLKSRMQEEIIKNCKTSSGSSSLGKSTAHSV